jgi:EAL domain-containing protein (putative c-di-GMP-specific phosphodiesterase class I)
VDSIKIDKVFIDRVTGGLRESALARAIVQLGQAMGLGHGGRGIETTEQAAVLRQLGCGYGQGHHVAKPMSNNASGRLIDQPQRLHRGGLSPTSEPPARSVTGR